MNVRRLISATVAIPVVVLVLSIVASAQPAPPMPPPDPAGGPDARVDPRQPPPTPPKPAPGQAEPPPRADRPPVARSSMRGQAVNVRIDVTISEQSGTAQGAPKTVSLTLADGEPGRIRSTADVPWSPDARAPGPERSLPLNVDVRPDLLEGGKVKVSLTLEYDTWERTDQGGFRPMLQVRESLTVILDNGKPLVVSQSADPVGDRKVSVEVKATTLR
jgi:hypothetical protein